MSDGFKLCPGCKETLPLVRFSKYTSHKDGFQHYCKECVRWMSLEKKYGITKDRYIELLKFQNNLCAICKKSSAVFCVDHDHKSGNVRGLLCKKCNSGIAHLKDNVIIITNAMDYLRKFK